MEIEAKLVEFPNIRKLYSHPCATFSPLMKFYGAILGQAYFEKDVYFDPVKVFLNSYDSKRLYRSLRRYMDGRHPNEEPGNISAHLWETLGPKTDNYIPRGNVFLQKGYIFIMK